VGVPWLLVAGWSLFLVVELLLLPLFPYPQRMEVRPEGVEVMTETTASLTTWEGIDRIVVTDTHTFLGAHILPRRAFEDDRAFEAFVDSARGSHEAAKLS
jgi:hypothetical protein